MDIRNVGNQSNVDRLGERTKRADGKRAEQAPTAAVRGDDARISDAGRETAASIAQLTERAKSDDGDREALVAAARERLLSGELDTQVVFAATAGRLADGGFLS